MAYIFLIVLVIACMMVSFFSWNKERAFNVNFEKIPKGLTKYNIDYCRSSGSHIDIKGWIFTDTDPANGKLIVTGLFNGKEIIIPSFTYVRPDVSTAFSRNVPFDNVGFNASISTKLLKTNSASSFNFYIQTKEKIYKAVNYACN